MEFQGYQTGLELLIKEQIELYDELDISKLITLYEYHITDNTSYIYFLYNKNTGLTKIGQTGDLTRRIKSIASTLQNYTGVTNNLVLLGVIPISNPILDATEKAIHGHFNESKRYGEWFEIDVYNELLSGSNNYTFVENTLVILDDVFDEYIPKSITHKLNHHDVIKFVDNRYKKHPFDTLFNTKNKMLEMYAYCNNNDTGFYFVKNYLTKIGLEKKVVSYILTDNCNRIYNISDLKHEKTDFNEIELLNKWLKNQ